MVESILLENVLLHDSPHDILIKGDRIAEVAASGRRVAEDVMQGVEIVDCTGKAAVPGFVNMHTHAGMTLMRGIGEDACLHDWLEKIWQVEKDIDEEYVYHSTKVACLEMIKTGTTAFNDQYWHMPSAYRAASEMGIRAMLSYVFLDRNDSAEAERQKKQCVQMYEASRGWSDMASLLISIHSVYTVSEPTIVWAAEFARNHGLKIHVHVSETEKEVEDCRREHGGMSPVEYLDSLGVLGPDVIAAHTLWLSEKDVEILGRRGVTCVHNVNSNLKLASGYRFLYNELRDAGANVCIGTDGCASSNNLDMLEAMKTAAMVQKAWRKEPSAMPLDELMSVASLNGYKALGTDAGRIEAGALADILLIDVDSYHFLSDGSFEAGLVYSAHSDSIDSVICNGRFVMRGRQVADEKNIIRDAKEVLKRKNR